MTGGELRRQAADFTTANPALWTPQLLQMGETTAETAQEHDGGPHLSPRYDTPHAFVTAGWDAQ